MEFLAIDVGGISHNFGHVLLDILDAAGFRLGNLKHFTKILFRRNLSDFNFIHPTAGYQEFPNKHHSRRILRETSRKTLNRFENIIQRVLEQLTGRVSNSAFINYEIFSSTNNKNSRKNVQRKARNESKEDFLFLTFFNGSKSNNFMSIYYVCVSRRVVILFLLFDECLCA